MNWQSSFLALVTIMALSTVARHANINVLVMGNAILVAVGIENTYKASIDFTLFGTAYLYN